MADGPIKPHEHKVTRGAANEEFAGTLNIGRNLRSRGTPPVRRSWLGASLAAHMPCGACIKALLCGSFTELPTHWTRQNLDKRTPLNQHYVGPFMIGGPEHPR
jgi:hypothetical protein